MTTTLKQRLTVKVLDDKQLEKFIKLQKEFKAKKKALEVLEKELTKQVKDGALPHPKSKYNVQLEDKQMRFTPKYRDWYVEDHGEEATVERAENEKKEWQKKVDKKEPGFTPNKKLVVKEK